eukprot:SAG11_NODE_1706_length_4412_cov_3.163691_3_plen_352_part_00
MFGASSYERRVILQSVYDRLYSTCTTALPPEPLLRAVVICSADPCDEIECSNHGSCGDGVCVCEEGFSGEHCETIAHVSATFTVTGTNLNPNNGGFFTTYTQIDATCNGAPVYKADDAYHGHAAFLIHREAGSITDGRGGSPQSGSGWAIAYTGSESSDDVDCGSENHHQIYADSGNANCPDSPDDCGEHWREYTGYCDSRVCMSLNPELVVIRSGTLGDGDALGAFFTVDSGPCTVSEGGRCVGRPDGYLPNEECEIVVGGGIGMISECLLDTEDGDWADWLTTPDGIRHGHGVNPESVESGCPIGASLSTGDVLTWASDGRYQGDNHGGALPMSVDGLGGGWQICFAEN